jgi:ubiquinone/menaquinone biosynthesis C-methylase UbiE
MDENNSDDIKKFATFYREPFLNLACDYYKAGMKALDIGAGEGAFAQMLGDDSIYLVDGNEESVNSLKVKYKNSYLVKLPGVTPFKNNFFDFIHCSHLVEHFQPSELYEFLVEIDRILASDGILVISAPLMWEGFYADLSHVKPYLPEVFKNYLCSDYMHNRTRQIVSTQYKELRLQYRYLYKPMPDLMIHCYRKYVQYAMEKILKFLKNRNLGYYEKTGYTLILKKG